MTAFGFCLFIALIGVFILLDDDDNRPRFV